MAKTKKIFHIKELENIPPIEIIDSKIIKAIEKECVHSQKQIIKATTIAELEPAYIVYAKLVSVVKQATKTRIALSKNIGVEIAILSQVAKEFQQAVLDQTQAIGLTHLPKGYFSQRQAKSIKSSINFAQLGKDISILPLEIRDKVMQGLEKRMKIPYTKSKVIPATLVIKPSEILKLNHIE